MGELEASLVEQIRNSSIGRYRHYASAQNHENQDKLVGIPAIIINVLLSSVFFYAISQDMPLEMKWIAAGLALLAALLSGFQTFFGFQRMADGHRRLGTRYLEVMRNTERLLNLWYDKLIDKDEYVTRSDALLQVYLQISRDSEGYPTSNKELHAAMKKEELRTSSYNARGL